jgi:putative ABC transport system permease protein
LSFASLILALVVIWISLPGFNQFTEKTLSLNPVENPLIFLEVIFLTLVIGIISGSYPAFYLSSFQPVTILKGSLSKAGKKSSLIRKILVVIQFIIAIVMISGTIVMTQQLGFIRKKDLGFEKKNQLILELQDTSFLAKSESFKNELLTNPDIISVTNTDGFPGKMINIRTMRIEQESNMEERAIIYAQVDYDYLKTFEFSLVEGRNFDKAMGKDAIEAVIINQAAAQEFGWEADALGKKIHYGFNRDGEGGRLLKVIGVVKDFNFKSLHNTIEPIIFFIRESPMFYLVCRINPENKKNALDFIDQKWNDYRAGRPFSYRYLEEYLDEMYTDENKTGKIINTASALTIFIALLGLLGLSSFLAQIRTKEIGIRKIHGATINQILLLLYKDFIWLILIAFAVAVPVAWWRLEIWLDSSFKYHLTIQFYYFLIAGFIAILAGFATISYFIVKAAGNNPVETIKYE